MPENARLSAQISDMNFFTAALLSRNPSDSAMVLSKYITAEKKTQDFCATFLTKIHFAAIALFYML